MKGKTLSLGSLTTSLLLGSLPLMQVVFATDIGVANVEEDLIDTTLLVEAEGLNESITLELESLRAKKLEIMEQRAEEERLRIQLEEEERLQRESHFQALLTTSETSGFKGYDVRTPSGISVEDMELALLGTGLEGLGSAYVQAEQEYGVNAVVLAGISGVESAWGTSNFARTRNNLFGYQAYDSNVNSAKHFDTKEEGILTVAKHLSDNYLTEGASYFNGYTLRDMNIRYASDEQWHQKITSVMNRLVNNIKENK